MIIFRYCLNCGKTENIKALNEKNDQLRKPKKLDITVHNLYHYSCLIIVNNTPVRSNSS